MCFFINGFISHQRFFWRNLTSACFVDSTCDHWKISDPEIHLERPGRSRVLGCVFFHPLEWESWALITDVFEAGPHKELELLRLKLSFCTLKWYCFCTLKLFFERKSTRFNRSSAKPQVCLGYIFQDNVLEDWWCIRTCETKVLVIQTVVKIRNWTIVVGDDLSQTAFSTFRMFI